MHTRIGRPGGLTPQDRERVIAFALLAALACGAALAQFDHTHAAWGARLAQHVKPIAGSNASQVDHKGFAGVQDVVAKCADQLADSPAERALLRAKKAPIRFLDYDWSLNDVRQ